MKKRIYLVTGAGGFIGSSLAKRIISSGNDVVTIDNLSTGVKENIPKGVRLINGDCSSNLTIKKLERYKFDAIFHIAGQSSGEISFEDPSYDLKTNTLSTLLLLKYALKSKCPKFIYAGSMSSYGDLKKLPANEESPLVPESAYAVGKIASENYLRIYSSKKLVCTSLRLFNVYGIGQNFENLKQGMISIYLAQALKNNHIEIKGVGERFRDFVNIKDVVNAFVLSETRETKSYEVFNVATGIPTSVHQILDLLEKNLKNKFTTKFIEGTLGDQFGIFGSYEKIERELGWKPQISLQEGIKDYCKKLNL